MLLSEIIHRNLPPEPWGEGDKIPWNAPDFSRRMLEMHLSQEHDWASRRACLIDTHTVWINKHFLGKNAAVLDLCCGPGFYVEGLAKLGHRCVGIDFSPASIDYGTSRLANSGADIRYRLEDVRTAEFGRGLDLVMMLFGEFNVFRREDALSILKRAHAALKPGGHILIEAHLEKEVKRQGEAPPFWQALESGLFKETPHLLLEEHFYDPSSRTSTTRYWIVDALNGETTKYASTMQAYSATAYAGILKKTGFTDICRYLDMGESNNIFKDVLTVYSAMKK